MSLSEDGTLLVGGVSLVSYTTVQGVLYGFAFALYIFCARSLYLQLKDRDQHGQHLFTLLYMSLAMALALISLAVDTRNMQTSFVDHGDYIGGGFTYSHEIFAESPTAVAGYVTAALLSFMMSSIQIWRLWVVWRVSRYSLFIVVLPVLSVLAFLGLQAADIVMFVRSELTPQLNVLFLYGEIVPPLYVSVTVTVLIIARIVVVRRKNIKIMGQSDSTNPYTSIYSMLIESFALESVWLFAQLFTAPSWTPVGIAVGDFLADTQLCIQVIAYLLVVYRVTTGRGWREETAEKLTTLQWNRDRLQTTRTGTQASIPVIHQEV